MTNIVSTWKAGFKVFDADAQLVAEELLSLCDDDDVGGITKQQIVDYARDEDTELHKCFEWDDSIAAERYRLVQAGDVVRLIVIKRTEEQIEQNMPEIRVFHKTDSKIGTGYKPISYIVKHEDEYEKMLQMAYAELHSFKMKYQHLQELDYIISLID